MAAMGRRISKPIQPWKLNDEWSRSKKLKFSVAGFGRPDLGKDPTWGTFVGYVSLSDDYEIPADDEFYSTTSHCPQEWLLSNFGVLC